VTGLGHIYLRRYVQGVLLFAVFATALDGVLVGALWQGSEARIVSLVSKVAVVAVWVLGMASVLKLTVFTDRERLRKRRDEKVREGLIHYLRGENEEARVAFEEARGCDVDRTDVDVLFHLGAVAGRLGRPKQARRWFRRCLAADRSGKWRKDIERELARAEVAPV